MGRPSEPVATREFLPSAGTRSIPAGAVLDRNRKKCAKSLPRASDVKNLGAIVRGLHRRVHLPRTTPRASPTRFPHLWKGPGDKYGRRIIRGGRQDHVDSRGRARSPGTPRELVLHVVPRRRSDTTA